MAKFKLHAPPNPLPLPPKPGARSGANHLPNFRSPNFGEKFSGPTAILTFIIIVVCMVNVGIMGYNFSYFKGTWRNNLFHSELNFLVMNCACFTGSVVGVLGTSVAPTPQSPFQKISHLYPKVVADAIYGFLSALAGTILSIQLSVVSKRCSVSIRYLILLYLPAVRPVFRQLIRNQSVRGRVGRCSGFSLLHQRVDHPSRDQSQQGATHSAPSIIYPLSVCLRGSTTSTIQ